MKILIAAFCLIITINISGQELIDGTYDFQTDPAKKYSLYIPSSYSADNPIDMMVSLHPWNVNRWNANSWCDTLKTFAETNNLLLVCPDGGTDGKVDDAIDTAFTTFLIDEVITQYNINGEQIYAIGFSWGGKTVYTYGLQHAERFAGFIPIGAAVTSGEVSPHVDKSMNEKYYIIHGSQDSPNTRYTPIVNMLDGPHCVESMLLNGVGHTIDFANRNQILTDAFQFLKSSTCGATNTIDETIDIQFLTNKVVISNQTLAVNQSFYNENFIIVNIIGDTVVSGLGKSLITPSQPGQYVLISSSGVSEKFMVVK